MGIFQPAMLVYQRENQKTHFFGLHWTAGSITSWWWLTRRNFDRLKFWDVIYSTYPLVSLKPLFLRGFVGGGVVGWPVIFSILDCFSGGKTSGSRGRFCFFFLCLLKDLCMSDKLLSTIKDFWLHQRASPWIRGHHDHDSQSRCWLSMLGWCHRVQWGSLSICKGYADILMEEIQGNESISWSAGFYTYQVVQDFFHQQYDINIVVTHAHTHTHIYIYIYMEPETTS